MPSILAVLFIVAFAFTVAGLLLSSRSPSRARQKGYLDAPTRRHIVGSRPIPARASRGTVQVAGNMPTIRRRAITPGDYRASVISTPLAGSSAGSWLVDRLGAWKITVTGMVALFLLGLYLLGLIVPHQLLWTSVWFNTVNQSPAPSPVAQHLYGASQSLNRLSQLDPAQYQSQQEYNTWAYSACSAASLTEVINAYGHHYRITDILQVEARIGEITPQLGLLRESGIQHTAQQFGFTTTWGHNLNLDQVIAAAKRGTPVIVSFPPDRYPGGHILVVRGGDSNSVLLADSSLHNRTQLSRAGFLSFWEGFSAILTPA